MTTQKRRGTGLYLVGVVLLGLCIFGALSLSAAREHAESSDKKTRGKSLALGPRVITARVELTPATREVAISGEVRAARQTTLYAKVSGYLKSVSVDKGDRVKAGQVLGIIEAPEMEKQIAAQSADLAIKQLDSARSSNLEANGSLSAQQRERAAADVSISQAELDRLRVLRGYQVIRAPFDGVVTARYADPGALLQDTGGALPLVDIADVDHVRVVMYLAQPDAVAVRIGDAAEISSDGSADKPVLGTVTRSSGQIDARTRTMLTEIDVDNRNAALLPGSFVRVRLSVASPQGLAMPAEALAIRRAQPMAAVVKDGRTHFLAIKIGATDGQQIRVLEGLKQGDVVVLHPGDDVIDGAAVQATPAPPKPG